MQLCKGISWQKEILGWRLGSVLRCWVLTLSRHVSKLSATVATSAFSQLGSSDTFCAVISRFVSERCADVFFSNIVLRTTFLLRLVSGLLQPRPETEPRKFFRTSQYPCAQAFSELASAEVLPVVWVPEWNRFRPPRDSRHHQNFRIPIQLITLCVRRCIGVMAVVRFG